MSGFDLGQTMMEGVVEATIGGLIASWSPKDLKVAIEHDVVLIDIVLQYYPNLVSTGMSVARHLPNGSGELTEDVVLRWIDKHHGKFSRTLKTPEGRAWLKKNLEAVRQVLWR